MQISRRLSVEGPDREGDFEVCLDGDAGADYHWINRTEADALIAALGCIGYNALFTFARECLAGYVDGSVGDLGGAWLQDKAIELGLLKECGSEGKLYCLVDWLS